jgi:nitroreductase
MDFFTLLDYRRSVREFSPVEISEEEENSILNAVNTAPSAGNLQAYGIISVRDLKVKKQITYAAFGQKCINQAPLVLIFYADLPRSAIKYRERGQNLYALQDATIAATFAHLTAVAMNLGSVWIGAFDPLTLSKELQLPPHQVPIVILPIGHPFVTPEKTSHERRSLDDLVKKI